MEGRTLSPNGPRQPQPQHRYGAHESEPQQLPQAVPWVPFWPSGFMSLLFEVTRLGNPKGREVKFILPGCTVYPKSIVRCFLFPARFPQLGLLALMPAQCPRRHHSLPEATEVFKQGPRFLLDWK